MHIWEAGTGEFLVEILVLVMLVMLGSQGVKSNLQQEGNVQYSLRWTHSSCGRHRYA